MKAVNGGLHHQAQIVRMRIFDPGSPVVKDRNQAHTHRMFEVRLVQLVRHLVDHSGKSSTDDGGFGVYTLGMPSLPAHLISRHKLKRCSICGQTFSDDAKPSLSKAFADHVRVAHGPINKPKDSPGRKRSSK